jgi:hypothetical protein
VVPSANRWAVFYYDRKNIQLSATLKLSCIIIQLLFKNYHWATCFDSLTSHLQAEGT